MTWVRIDQDLDAFLRGEERRVSTKYLTGWLAGI